MLPGFNHNVRYQERTFHVQTEDNGLSQARLVTQTFIDGQLVDIARGSYRDILDAGHDDKAQTEQIRLRMQEQHKAQMKRLVGGELDERIRVLFGESPETVDTTPPAEPPPPRPSTVPPGVRAAAEALPNANLEMATLDIEPPHPALQPTPSKSEPSAARQSHPDFLIELDEEMRRQVPWRPTDEQLAAGDRFAQATEDTVSMDVPPSELRSGGIPAPRAATPAEAPPRPAPAPPPRHAPPVVHRGTAAASQAPVTRSGRAIRPRPAPTSQAAPRPGAGRAIPGRPAFPPAGDTIVDMGLPAALKETLERRRAASASRPPSQPPAPPPRPNKVPPAQVEAPTPVDSRFRPGRTARTGRQGLAGDPNDTMLEIDAAQLHAEIAAQRARLRQASPTPGTPEAHEPTRPPATPPPPKDAPRGNIVVVERSLDDVILGYLSDDD